MQNIRNIAIIAHVDHGKTTLVDKLMLAGNLLKEQDNDKLTLDNNVGTGVGEIHSRTYLSSTRIPR